MRVDTRPRKRNAPRIAEKSAPAFLQWLRGRPCFALGAACLPHSCDGKIEAAHVDFAGDKGMGTKASDKYAIPLCAKHHYWQHRNGWNWFVGAYGHTKADILKAAAAYWRAWPGRIAWERKLSDGL